MAVINVHERRLPASAAEAGVLLDGLAGSGDRLWPKEKWPAMRFDRPLSVGAIGGHGPIRYTVEEYQPGQRIRFRFTGPRGLDGFHEFTVTEADDGSLVRHLLAARPRGPMRLSWPLVFRGLHDACVEDCLDNAERALTGTVRAPTRWSGRVRLLRAVTGRTVARRR
ncbi:SRPBCC family protein [Nocardia noduli]|uniref:SRPBCC family protein n=1 Tax=Nocardia noduli TaxID=2815722 RepID=UPI001C22BD6F|nr:SRPBCC family protein [Nocardia noduli]